MESDLYTIGEYRLISMALNEEAESNMRQDVLENPEIYEAAAATPDNDAEE
jgi:hypothetical protein